MLWFTCHFPRVGHLGSFQIRIIINKAMVTLHNVCTILFSIMSFNFRLLSALHHTCPFITLGFSVILSNGDLASTSWDCDPGEARQ